MKISSIAMHKKNTIDLYYTNCQNIAQLSNLSTVGMSKSDNVTLYIALSLPHPDCSQTVIENCDFKLLSIKSLVRYDMVQIVITEIVYMNLCASAFIKI